MVKDIVFIKDIGVQFFLPYQDRTRGNLVVRSRILIAKRYLRGWFWVDVVSVIPFDLIPVDALNRLKAVRLVKLLKLLKLGRVLRANRTLARWETYMALSYAKISMYGFAVGIVFVSHWMACLWGLVDAMRDRVGCDHNCDNGAGLCLLKRSQFDPAVPQPYLRAADQTMTG